MSTNDIVKTLKNAHGEAVLETQAFGKNGQVAVWIEMKSIHKIARTLKETAGIQMDWLENLSVMDLDGTLVLTYFVRAAASPDAKETLILRGTLLPKSTEARVDAPSVQEVWPMARAMEAEASDLFGIRFTGAEQDSRLLPEGWIGYPLRKSYVFPEEFLGIAHVGAQRHAPEAKA